MKGERRWLGRRVWIADADGGRHNGTLWWDYETTVVIREDGMVGLQVLPKASQGTRWGFTHDSDNT